MNKPVYKRLVSTKRVEYSVNFTLFAFLMPDYTPSEGSILAEAIDIVAWMVYRS